MDQTGLVTALAQGTASVIAMAQDGSNVYGELALTVTAAAAANPEPTATPDPTAAPEPTATPDPTSIPEASAAPDAEAEAETEHLVMFFCQPEEAIVQVFDVNDEEVLPEEDGTYLLPLGEYYYNVIAEGYLPVLEEELLLDETSLSPVEIEVALEEGEMPLRAAANVSGTCGATLTWSLDTTTGKLTISGTGAMTDYSWGGTPWYNYIQAIKSVVISDDVITIGDNAFYNCNSLSSITIPNSVTTIKAYAFSGCSSLSNISISDVVTTIGYAAFSGCSNLSSITIPDGVTSIVDFAFSRCSSLSSITIPNSVTTIGQYAFSGCSSLKSITIPNSVTTIGQYVFSDCSSELQITFKGTSEQWGALNTGYSATCLGLGATGTCGTSLTWELDGAGKLTISGTGAMTDFTWNGVPWYDYRSSIKSVELPSGITSIGTNAFAGCSLNRITIPFGVTNIGQYAFSGCSSLSSVSIPDSVTSIDYGAFNFCSSLSSITIPSSVTSFGWSVFDGCSSDLEIIFNGTQEQWDTLTTLHEATCLALPSGHCGQSLTWNLDKPTGKLTISGTGAMTDCTYNYSPWLGHTIRSVEILSGVTSISSYAFYNCSSLSSITIPDGINSIGSHAFSGCANLTLVDFPSCVETVGEGAFANCYNLRNVNVRGSIDGWLSISFADGYDGVSNPVTMCYENRDKETPISITFNNSTDISITIPRGISNIPAYAFCGWICIKSLTLPDTVSSFGEGAFAGCRNLNSVTIPDSINAISSYAFQGCRSLVSITIPDSVTTIGGYAFSWCISLSSITIPDSITTIGEYTFAGCTNLIRVDFPASVKTVGGWAFIDCSKLRNVNVRGRIGDWLSISFADGGHAGFANPAAVCFQNVLSIAEITITFNNSSSVSLAIPEGITSIPTQAFAGWWCIKSLTLADTVESIGTYAFLCCNNLSSVNLGTGLKSIGEKAFQQCNAIVNITLPESLNTISEGAFYLCEGLSSISIPGTVKTIGNSAFNGCNRLATLVIKDGVETIGSNAFQGTRITSVKLPNSVTSLGREAFWGVGTGSTGASVTLSNRLEAIPEGCFCAAHLKQIVIPEGVKRIEDKAFQYSILSTISLPSSLTYVGKYAFDGCSNLKTVQYAGSPQQWNNIEIDIYNEPLKKASPESVYTVIYDANGGTGAPESQSGRYGTSCKLSTRLPQSDEHYFVGWATTPDAVEAEYQPGDTVQPDGTLRLYAVWAGEKYAVALILNGGALKYGIVFDSYISSRAVPLPTARDLSYPGMRFDGWTYSNAPEDQSYVTQIGAEESGDKTFYAKWSAARVEIHAPNVLLAGKSVALSATVSTELSIAPRFVWELADGAELFASLSKTGVLKANAVSEAHDIEVLVTDESGQLGTVSHMLRIVPALSSLVITDEEGAPVTGQSVNVDLNEKTELYYTAACVPADAEGDIVWSSSDSKGVYGSYTDNGDGSITVALDPEAKPGCITLTATDTVSRKKATVKLITSRITTEILPVTNPGDGLSTEPSSLDPNTALVGGGTRTLSLQLLGNSDKAKITWTIPEEYAPYATVKAGTIKNGVATGTVTAKQVSHPVQIRVDAEASDNPALYATIWLWIMPRTQLVQILDESGSPVSGMTVCLDLNADGSRSLELQAVCYPDTASSKLSWSSSDRSEKLGVLTVSDDGSASFRFHDSVAAGKTVTLTATAADGSKKSAKVTLKPMRYAHELSILGAPTQLMGGKSVTLKTDLATNKAVNDKTVQWSIPADCAEYATIAANGKLTAKSFAGSEPVMITVTARVPFTGAESSVDIQVLPNLEKSLTIYADGVAVNGSNRTCDLKDELLILAAEVFGLEDDSIKWEPTKPNGAAYFADGDSPYLTLNKPGAVTITATAADGKTKARFRLTVVKTADMLELQGNDVMLGGSKQTLKAVFTDSEGNVVKPTNSKLVWTLVSGSAYAKLSTSGVLTANKVTAVHTVTVSVKTQDGSLSAELPITINPAANNIRLCTQAQYETRWSLTGQTVDLNAEDPEQRSVQLLATGYPYYASSSQVSWKCSNPAVAEVDEDGLVTLKWDEKKDCWKTGKVVITATALDGSRKSAKLTLNFTSLMKELSFEDTEYRLPAGKSLSLKAICNWEATNKKVIWSMTGDTAWVKLSNGKVTAGKVTAPKTVIITATAADGGGASASCTVTIVP